MATQVPEPESVSSDLSPTELRKADATTVPSKDQSKEVNSRKGGFVGEALIFDTPIKRGLQGDSKALITSGQRRKPSAQAISR